MELDIDKNHVIPLLLPKMYTNIFIRPQRFLPWDYIGRFALR